MREIIHFDGDVPRQVLTEKNAHSLDKELAIKKPFFHARLLTSFRFIIATNNDPNLR